MVASVLDLQESPGAAVEPLDQVTGGFLRGHDVIYLNALALFRFEGARFQLF